MYRITTGAFRVYRGYQQFDDAWHHPIVCNSPLHYAEDASQLAAAGPKIVLEAAVMPKREERRNSIIGGLAVLLVRGVLLWGVVPVAAIVWPVVALGLRCRGVTFGAYLGWVAFHDSELVEFADAALAADFFAVWADAHSGALPLRADQCVGYRVPPFLGGRDLVGNLEN